MTRAKDISKIVTDADLSGTLDIAGTVTAGGLTVNGTADVDGVVTVDRVINATTSSDPWLKGVNGSNTETFFLKPSGQAYFGSNVGIGTSSPSELIHANGSAVSALKLTTDTYTNGTVFKVQGDGASYIYNTENAMLRFGTNNLERIRITSGGNVGIGTTSPSYKLHVRGADATANLVVGNTTEGTQLEVLTYQDDKVVLRSNDSSNTARILAFETGTTERMRIDTSGRVGIGATALGARLNIVGANSDTWAASATNGLALNGSDQAATSTITTYLDSSSLRIGAGVTQKTGITITGQSTGTGSTIQFRAGNSERMRIRATGNVGIGDTSPQRKLSVNGIAKFRNTITLGGSNSSTDYNAYFANEAYANNASDSTVTLGTHSTRPLIFATNTTERMRITDGGKVGIGTTSPVANLEIKKLVSTTGSMTDTALHLTTDGTTGRKLNIGFGLGGGVANTNAAVIGFDVADGSGATQGDLFFSTRSGTSDSVPTERMRITSTGRPIFYQTTSSLTHRYATTNYESMYVSRFAINMQGNQSYTITFNGFVNGMYHFNCFAAHWNSTYTLYRNSYMGLQSSAVFSEYNLHDRSSAAQGAFSFTNPSNAKIAVVKSAGTYIGGMNAIIEIKGPALLNIDSVA